MPSPTRRSIQAAWRRRIGPLWKSRAAAFLGAVLLGLTALAFADAADLAQRLFQRMTAAAPWLPLALTPAGFLLIAAAARRFAPESRGSGIPQVIAASEAVEASAGSALLSLKTMAAKFVLTIGALLVGASVGREGPTVQIGASVMAAAHRLLRVPLTPAVVIAGGAAGVAAAFNTPLAGVAFAIEELAAAYEQRLALLVMASVMVAGLVSLTVAGDYVYFGATQAKLPIPVALAAAPLAGVVGGALGGLFARALLHVSRGATRVPIIRRRPLLFAALCGLAVGAIGVATHGLTFGTGYDAARTLVEGGHQPWWFAPGKWVSTLATSASGLPGGIFAPSLATGAGVGGILGSWFPEDYRSALAMLGMIGYFVGVVRAPLTGVVIVSEMTADHGMILPLFLSAVIADVVSKAVCHERLYYGLADAFRPKPAAKQEPAAAA